MALAAQDFVKTVSPTLPRLNKARVVVIFGNINSGLVSQMAHEAAKLYLQGKIEKIIVSGGKKFQGKNHTEAELARTVLLSYDISGRHILMDNHSFNSHENVTHARRLLLKTEGVLKHEPVLFFGRDYASRRFLMTIAKTWPEAIPAFTGFDSFITLKNKWHNCPEIVDLLKTDLKKWDDYIHKGHIKPVNPRHIGWNIHKANKIKPLSRP